MEGFRKLAMSLVGQPSLLTLRINGMLIGEDEVAILKQLFGHPLCDIKNLEMEELEVVEGQSNDVIETVSLLKRLYTFDFSNNNLTQKMTESIVKMLNKYEMLEILCFDHCDMTDSICKYVFHSIVNTKLQFVNLSWN